MGLRPRAALRAAENLGGRWLRRQQPEVDGLRACGDAMGSPRMMSAMRGCSDAGRGRAGRACVAGDGWTRTRGGEDGPPRRLAEAEAGGQQQVFLRSQRWVNRRKSTCTCRGEAGAAAVGGGEAPRGRACLPRPRHIVRPSSCRPAPSRGPGSPSAPAPSARVLSFCCTTLYLQ